MYRQEILKIVVTSLILAVLNAVSVPLCYFFAHMNLSDCFLIPGAVYLGAAGLVFVHRAGTFDTFEYQFQNFLRSFQKDYRKSYETANEYHLAMKEKRKSHSFPYVPYLVLGGINLALALVFAFYPVGR